MKGRLPAGPRSLRTVAPEPVEVDTARADGRALEYAGRDSLEAVQQAFDYNRLLLGPTAERAHGARKGVDFGAGAGALAVPLQRVGCQVECVELDPVLRARLSD